jgi:hypothetical protein
LKNSHDVQDALIEGYFRYNDLSRMEADDILMNISEIENPNNEYVDLDMLSVPVGALSSPIEVNKSVITFMLHFVFVLLFFI